LVTERDINRPDAPSIRYNKHAAEFTERHGFFRVGSGTKIDLAERHARANRELARTGGASRKTLFTVSSYTRNDDDVVE
jgi:hypothetical protein